MQRMAALLPGIEVAPSDKFGLSGDDMEALAFAWLAARTVSGLPGNLALLLGQVKRLCLGQYTLKIPIKITVVKDIK